MLLNDLFEDAEADANRSLNADKVLQRAISHLYQLEKSGEQLPTAILGGKNLPCLPAEDFNAPPFWHDLIFIFQPDEYALGGKAVKMKEKLGQRYQYLVVVGVDGSSPSEIIKSLRYDRVEIVIRHELQHIIDYKRFKGDVFQSREPNFKSQDGEIKPSGRSEAEFKDYHNSSAETNAYWHNLAEPLLKRIRFMKQHGVEMIEIFSPLPEDFKQYLADNLKTQYGVLKQHWDHLTDDNKQKVLKRLSKLFDLYWEMINKYNNSKEATS